MIPTVATGENITTPELRREINRRSIINLPLGELRSEYHLRFSLAFAPLALALIGIPLGMTIERGGRGVGFGAAVLVLFFYYLLLVMGMNLADRESIPAVPALWMANGVTTLGGRPRPLSKKGCLHDKTEPLRAGVVSETPLPELFFHDHFGPHGGTDGAPG
jgi:hypothetical protein